MHCLNVTFVICLLGTLQQVSVNAALLKLFCGSQQNVSVTDLENPLPLLNASTCYDSSRPSMIYAFGFTETANGSDTAGIVGVYLKTNRFNVFLIDWEKEAATIMIAPVGYLLHAVPNAIIVGKKCGDALIKMSQNQFDLTTVHLIGHSLGAHLMGYCGKEVKEYNKTIPHITGLDPAGPVFEGAIAFDGLDSSSATFVDVLHTNPGYNGNTEQLGSVDIWFNNVHGTQPGCSGSNSLIDKVTNTSSSCAHQRAWIYYSRAVEDPAAFQARKCESYDKWRSQNTTNGSNKIIYIGETISRCARGNYYLSTDPVEPYGRGEKGLNP